MTTRVPMVGTMLRCPECGSPRMEKVVLGKCYLVCECNAKTVGLA